LAPRPAVRKGKPEDIPAFIGPLALACFCPYRNRVKPPYDPAKREWTLIHRKLDFEDAPLVFASPCFDFEDDRIDYGERRICTVGFLRRRMVMVVWTRRGRRRWIISMRKCNAREVKRYRPFL
jgi:uncharacterized protein